MSGALPVWQQARMMYDGIEYWPENRQCKQLFILLHGVGADAGNLVSLAEMLRREFPQSGIFIPEGSEPFDGPLAGRQWFSIRDITDESRIQRVAAAMPSLEKLVKNSQQRFGVLLTDTALVGFSQGAIMALEYSIAHDGGVGRVVAFSGRFANLPEAAPEYTTLHLLHGEEDEIVSVKHSHAAFERLVQLAGDATLDVASGVGHELHPALAGRAIHRLKTVIPLRSWKLAMQQL